MWFVLQEERASRAWAENLSIGWDPALMRSCQSTTMRNKTRFSTLSGNLWPAAIAINNSSS